MESIVRDALVKYMKDNLLFTDRQFGFLGGRSTTLQLLKVLDDWTEVLDRGGYVDVVYCDLMKAFDTVPHGRLIQVLEYYGVDSLIVKWIGVPYRQETTCINQWWVVHMVRSE